MQCAPKVQRGHMNTTGEYDMTDLLTLLVTDHAEGLSGKDRRSEDRGRTRNLILV